MPSIKKLGCRSYGGGHSFEVFNDDYPQIRFEAVARSRCLGSFHRASGVKR